MDRDEDRPYPRRRCRKMNGPGREDAATRRPHCMRRGPPEHEPDACGGGASATK
jgi:hypothetical protein